METRYTVYCADGTQADYAIDLPKKPSYDELKDVISPYLNGGWLERVSVLEDGKQLDMFVDEEGLLKGLPKNEAATAIYHNYWKTHHPDKYEKEKDRMSPIVGTAILFHRRVWY